MTSKLLPCPFCGGEPVLKQYRADGLEIKCSSCHSGRQQRWMYKGRDWLEAKMIEKWNERAPLSPDHSGGAGKVVLRCSFCDTTDQAGNPWSTAFSSKDGKLIYRVAGCKDHKHLVDACLDKVKELNQ